MKIMKKRVLCLLLAVIMACGLLPTMALAADGEDAAPLVSSITLDQGTKVTEPGPTVSNSTIAPTSANFDKFTQSDDYKDVAVTLTLNGNTFSGIWNGETQLAESAYAVEGTTVTLKREFLATLTADTVSLTFKFSAGEEQTLTITVSDTTPAAVSHQYIKNVEFKMDSGEYIFFNMAEIESDAEGAYNITIPYSGSLYNLALGSPCIMPLELTELALANVNNLRASAVLMDVNGNLISKSNEDGSGIRFYSSNDYIINLFSFSNVLANTNGSFSVGNFFNNLQLGEYDFKVSVFNIENPIEYDECLFHLTLVPYLGTLQVIAEDKQLLVTPDISDDNNNTQSIVIHNWNYNVKAPDVTEIKLEGTVTNWRRFDGTSQADFYYRGEKRTDEFAGTGVPIDLTLCNKENDTYIVPFSIVWGEENATTRSDYTLYVATGEADGWTITESSAGGTYNKGDVVQLYVKVEGGNADNVVYQWQWSRNAIEAENNVFRNDIENASESEFIIPTGSAGRRYYRCVVTDKTTGAFQYSEPAKIDIRLGQVNTPIIVTQPGKNSGAKTEYFQGETVENIVLTAGTSDNLNQAADKPAAKVDITWYYNNKPSVDGAKCLDSNNYAATKADPYIIAEHSFEELVWVSTFSYNVTERLAVGEHYFFGVITATALDDPENSASITSDFIKITIKERKELDGFEGTGTEDNPYLITSVEQLEKISEYVVNGNSLAGAQFRFTNNITLPLDWEPIGKSNGGSGMFLLPFSGIIDGNGYTLTVPKGGKPLLNYARDALVKNLNIYGEEINGAGLLDKVVIDYGGDGVYQSTDPDVITIENVTLLRGSKTRGSGLVNGGANSGINDIFIKNCTIEEGVAIGYTKDQNYIGSFVGRFNGRIENSISYATVYGTNNVGGLVGGKSQAMGDCEVINCAFIGSIEATGGRIGGIIGSGYIDGTAPNTPPVTVRNCYVNAQITGNTTLRIDAEGFDMGSGIGGIVGSEIGVSAAWNDGFITDNYFFGTITDIYENIESGYSRVGGILGELGAYDPSLQNYENNYYLSNSNYDGLGYLRNANPDWKPEEESFIPKTAEAFADGTVLKALNASETSYKNWIQGPDGYPVHSDAAVPLTLTLSGEYQTTYYIGDAFSTAGMTFTVAYNDGTTAEIPASEITFTGFDSSQQGVYTVLAEKKPLSTEFKVTVLLPSTGTDSDYITVYFQLLGDREHDSDEDGQVHTLFGGGLQVWLPERAYTVDQNILLWDLLLQILEENGIDYSNPTGNYIKEMTYNGVTIGEFTNGYYSGWMYTLNGEHPLLGVSEQFLENGDKIVFHFTDDYTKEQGSEEWNEPYSAPDKKDETKTETIKETVETKPVEVKDGKANVSIDEKALNNKIDSLVKSAGDKSSEQVVEIKAEVKGDANEVSVGLPTASLSKLAEKTEATVDVQTPNGNVAMPSEALKEIVNQAGKENIEVKIQNKAPEYV